MEAITREEKIMSGENLTPITRKEMFLAKAAGQDVETPEPITREEIFLSKIGGGSGLGDKYFEGGYTDVVLENATRLKKYAFYNDSVLERLSIPKVTVIDTQAVYVCPNLSEINFGDELIEIGMSSISGGTVNGKHVQRIVIPKTVKTVGGGAFSGLAGLDTVTFLGTPTTIGLSMLPAFSNTVKNIFCPWSEGEVAGSPWGATNATINYNYKGD